MRIYLTLLLLSLRTCVAFQAFLQFSLAHKTGSQLCAITDDISRRDWIHAIAAGTLFTLASPSFAEESSTRPILMKEFVDPQGYFSMRVPNDFYTIRRSSKGDLPDSKGRGRRGSTIFTAGNMGKAELIAVERFPTRVLLEENGIEPTGSLNTFEDLGEAAAIANLLNIRREKDKPGGSRNSSIFPLSVKLSDDKKDLFFRVKSEIDVQKPDLLMETYGVSQLFRITTAKASLRGSDGNIMAVFASALEKDFDGPDGEILQEAVDSFTVKEREFGF